MSPREQKVEVDGHTLKLSNLDKVMYPQTGTTKGEVIDYYHRAASVMIPQVTRRPATRKRWVDGVGTEKKPGKVFFRKDLEDHRSEEHTSELQSRGHLVCRRLLEKKNKTK